MDGLLVVVGGHTLDAVNLLVTGVTRFRVIGVKLAGTDP